jgi:hypothetical protein
MERIDLSARQSNRQAPFLLLLPAKRGEGWDEESNGSLRFRYQLAPTSGTTHELNHLQATHQENYGRN